MSFTDNESSLDNELTSVIFGYSFIEYVVINMSDNNNSRTYAIAYI